MEARENIFWIEQREGVQWFAYSQVTVSEYWPSTIHLPYIAAATGPTVQRAEFFSEAHSAQLSKKITDLLESSSWDGGQQPFESRKNMYTERVTIHKKQRVQVTRQQWQFHLGDLIEINFDDEQLTVPCCS